jgi:hypothetical protein
MFRARFDPGRVQRLLGYFFAAAFFFVAAFFFPASFVFAGGFLRAGPLRARPLTMPSTSSTLVFRFSIAAISFRALSVKLFPVRRS